jgi:hypothetical protein
MITISNIDETIDRLNKLQADSKPLWGGMTAQQMVEHLATTIKISSGKLALQQRTTVEEGNAIKAQIVYTDMEFPMGLKSPTIPDGPPVYEHEDLSKAVGALKLELADFNLRYKENPDATHVHPRLGAMTHAEWLILHGKHFKHHFKQFDIL